MKVIALTKGIVAVVDDVDFPRVVQFKWRAMRSASGKYWYACRSAPRQKGAIRQTILLHRFIMEPPVGYEVDHVDRDGLNCTRANMRICRRAENSRNRGPNPGGTSRFKGVHWRNDIRKWYAGIMFQDHHYYLGCHTTEEEAARQYDVKARELFGGFAALNFP